MRPLLDLYLREPGLCIGLLALSLALASVALLG